MEKSMFFVIASIVLVHQATAATNCVTVTASLLNVRSADTTSSMVLGQVSLDDILASTAACSGSWCQVYFNGTTAYVHQNYVTAPATCACVCVKLSSASGALNVRSQAAMTPINVLGNTLHGQCLESTDTCLGKWCEVVFNNEFAYVRSSYVTDRGSCSVPAGNGTKARPCNMYGDIMTLQPTGASSATAGSDGLSVSGVAASNALVTTDEARLRSYKSCFESVGSTYGVHPALIAAIASRESRGGNALDSQGYGDNGNGYGLMQCDVNTSGLDCTDHTPYSCGHINQLIKQLFVPYIRKLRSKSSLSSWSTEQILQGAVAAYNFGTGNVQTLSGLDSGSTNDDYSNDVVARAQYLVRQYGWTC